MEKLPKLFLVKTHNCLDPASVYEVVERFKRVVKVRDASGHCCNASDTLVLKLNSRKDIHTAVELTKAMKELACDEITVKSTLKGVYMRFWWD
jgi:hypothetical protein